jgi:hypothetical protein
MAATKLAEASKPSTSYMPTVSNDPLEGRSESCHCHEVFIAGRQAVLPWAEARGIANAANTRDKSKMRGSTCFISFFFSNLSGQMFWMKRRAIHSFTDGLSGSYYTRRAGEV